MPQNMYIFTVCIVSVYHQTLIRKNKSGSKLHTDSVHWDKVVVSWCDDKTKMGYNYSIQLKEKKTQLLSDAFYL